MIDQFHELLQALGRQLGISLQPDKRGACKLNIRNLLHVQLEYDPSRERILIACFICDIPPGKLRENVFRDALKANYPFPQIGIFAYCERNNKLSVFIYLPISGLTGEKFASLLSTFIEQANKWKEAVETGQTSTLVLSSNQEFKPIGLRS